MKGSYAKNIKYLVKNRRTQRVLSRHIKLAVARRVVRDKYPNNNDVRIYTVNGVQIQ